MKLPLAPHDRQDTPPPSLSFVLGSSSLPRRSYAYTQPLSRFPSVRIPCSLETSTQCTRPSSSSTPIVYRFIFADWQDWTGEEKERRKNRCASVIELRSTQRDLDIFRKISVCPWTGWENIGTSVLRRRGKGEEESWWRSEIIKFQFHAIWPQRNEARSAFHLLFDPFFEKVGQARGGKVETRGIEQSVPNYYSPAFSALLFPFVVGVHVHLPRLKDKSHVF